MVAGCLAPTATHGRATHMTSSHRRDSGHKPLHIACPHSSHLLSQCWKRYITHPDTLTIGLRHGRRTHKPAHTEGSTGLPDIAHRQQCGLACMTARGTITPHEKQSSCRLQHTPALITCQQCSSPHQLAFALPLALALRSVPAIGDPAATDCRRRSGSRSCH